MVDKPHCLIPAFDGYKEAKGDLQDLLNSLVMGGYNKYFRIVVLLDGSSRIFEEEFKRQYPSMEFWNHKGNAKNFCGNLNIGLRETRGKTGALVVNMDCIMPHVDHVLTHMVGTQYSSAQSVDLPNKPLEEVVSLLNELSSVDVEYIDVKTLPSMMAPGYCFWIGAQTLDEIGIWPEHLYKASFDDNHMIALALLAGKKVEVSQCRVYHKGSHLDQMKEGKSRTGAYSPVDGSLELHRMKFQDYWKIPANIPADQYIKWILANYTWTYELREAIICT